MAFRLRLQFPNAIYHVINRETEPAGFRRDDEYPDGDRVSWERGRRKPTGAALRLLDIARQHPEVLVAG